MDKRSPFRSGGNERPAEIVVVAGAAIWDLIKPFVPAHQLDKASHAFDDRGRRSMEVRELVRALMSADLLAARQCVSDAHRSHVQCEQLERPRGLTDREMSIAAGIIELLAAREGFAPPPWTKSVGGVSETFVLDPGLEQMPRSFEQAKRFGPEPLRKRNLIALPDFLDVA